jgi:serine protease
MQQEFGPDEFESFHKPLFLNREVKPYGIDLVKASSFDSSKVSNRNVCIIDSGYDLEHPDLQSSNIDGYTGSESAGPWNEDGDGHGTHIAGTIAALGDNGQGVVGVVPNGMLNLYIVRIFDNCGDWAWGSDLINAVYECVNAGSNIINMSLGTSQYSKYWEHEFRDIYEKKDVLLVSSAGNDGNSKYSYPAALDSVMGVAAVTDDAERASFSQYNDQVDISGPGKYVLSTIPSVKGSYAYYSGTSSKS